MSKPKAKKPRALSRHQIDTLHALLASKGRLARDSTSDTTFRTLESKGLVVSRLVQVPHTWLYGARRSLYRPRRYYLLTKAGHVAAKALGSYADEIARG